MSTLAPINSRSDPMTRARTELVIEHPFFAVLALRTKLKIDTHCPTAWCDGLTIGYNPEFVAGLSRPQVVGLLIHELYHKVFMHHLRRNQRDPEKWNIACDYAINLLIKQIPRVELPDDGLCDVKYADKTAEEIYNLLPPQPKGGGGRSDPGGCGEVRDPEQGGGTAAEIEAKLKQDIATAVQVAKMKGKLPAGMDIYLDELLEPKVPWKDVLRRFLTERARSDFSWSRPNRRFVYQDLYLPSMQSEDVAGEFAFGVDTSGSMLCVLPEVMAEVNGIMEEINPLRSHVLYCDAAVGRYDIFERDQPLEVHTNGGGGTDFRPVFSKIEEEGIRPKCLVFITDGYGTFPDTEPPYPVLWVMTEDVEPPFGEVLRIET